MFLREEKIEHYTDSTSKLGKKFKVKKTRTLYHFQCDKCGGQFILEKGNAYNKNKQKYHYCSGCVKKYGKHRLAGEAQTQHYYDSMDNEVGKIQKIDQGYAEVYVGPNYPYRDSIRMREHIYVMETHLKRKLEHGEVVHHIDGDKTNNSLDNLHLMTIKEHNQCHAESEQIVFDLVKQGKVRFNKATERYELI